MAVAWTFSACNHAADTKPAPAATEAAPQKERPVAALAAVFPTSPAIPVAPLLVSASTPQPIAAPPADAASSKLVSSDRSQNLVVAQHTFRLLTHVQSIPATKEQTVEWWELRNDKDRVIFHTSYPVEFENGSFTSTVDISANSFNTAQGGGILVRGGEEPSDPSDGGWVQLFGFKYGRDKYGVDDSLFGPFGPPIYIQGQFLDIGTDALRPTPTSFTGGATLTVMRDILKFRLWTGNFEIEYPVLINWITGRVQPAWQCLETTSKGRVQRCSYPITVDAHRDAQPTFVRLFPEPDEGFSPKHVVVQPQSKVEFLEARTPVSWNETDKSISFGVDGDVWLKVSIDGQVGWIHTQEDFDAVGLPQAG
jgi:hypothetical protein